MHSQYQLIVHTEIFHVHVHKITCWQQAEAGEASESSRASDPELPLAIAELQVRRGLLLLNTDQLADGEAAVAAGVPPLEAALPRHALLLLRAYQALALQHGERDRLEPALQRLQAAEALYRQHLAPRPAAQAPQHDQALQPAGVAEAGAAGQPGQANEPGAPAVAAPSSAGHDSAAAGAAGQDAQQGKPGAAAAVGPGSAVAGAGSEASVAAPAQAGAAGGAQAPGAEAADGAAGGAAVPASAADQAHTMTLFYLAQVHGQMGHQAHAVAYCAATLARQVTQGALRCLREHPPHMPWVTCRSLVTCRDHVHAVCIYTAPHAGFRNTTCWLHQTCHVEIMHVHFP